MKIPEPIKMSSGNWFIRMRLQGQEITVTKPTRKECIDTATLLKAEYRAGKRRTASNKTLYDAIDDYIKKRENVLSVSTVRGYRIIQRNRFKELSDCPISSLDDSTLISAVNTEAKKCNAKTLRNSWRFICSVMRENNITPPKVTLPQVIPNERPFLEPDEIPKFVKAVHGTDIEIPALLALSSLRLSEILALRWEDIDTDNKIIHVRGSAVPDEHSRTVIKKETKNTSSRRDVPIFIPELLNALRSNGTGSVVLVTGQTVRARINAVCESSGLPLVGVHGLRHSFASLCYSLRVPEKAVMTIGGWSNDATMKRIYTHLAQKDMESNIKALNDFFKPKKASKKGK